MRYIYHLCHGLRDIQTCLAAFTIDSYKCTDIQLLSQNLTQRFCGHMSAILFSRCHTYMSGVPIVQACSGNFRGVSVHVFISGIEYPVVSGKW